MDERQLPLICSFIRVSISFPFHTSMQNKAFHYRANGMSSEMIWWGDFFPAKKNMFDQGPFVIFIFTLNFGASVTEPENPLFP